MQRLQLLHQLIDVALRHRARARQAERSLIRVERISFLMGNYGFQIGTKLNHCSGNSRMIA